MSWLLLLCVHTTHAQQGTHTVGSAPSLLNGCTATVTAAGDKEVVRGEEGTMVTVEGGGGEEDCLERWHNSLVSWVNWSLCWDSVGETE